MRLGSLTQSGGGLWLPTHQKRGLVLPFTADIITLLIPDSAHVDLDESGLVTKSRATIGSDSQTQSDPARRYQWTASSAMNGRPALTRVAATSPYLLTASGLALAQPFVIYSVCCPPVAAGVVLMVDGNTSSARAYQASLTGNSWQAGGSSGTINGTHTMGSGGTLFTSVYNGASSSFSINNGAAATGTIATATPIDYFVWGARFAFGNNWEGSLGLLCIQSGAPSGAQLSANNAAIMQWFGIS